MEIFVDKDYAAMSRRAADIVAARVRENPTLVLSLATGSAPHGMYEDLAAQYAAGSLSFRQVTGFGLDEYRGLTRRDRQSFYAYLKTNFADVTDLPIEHLHVIDGTAEDTAHACAEYENRVAAAGGVDVQILGIGTDGHIGFNEPEDCFSARTHCVRLAEETIRANARFFEKAADVPREALTMGIGTIFRAREILLLASGAEKAEILYETVYGKVRPEVPASILQFHPNTKLFLDEAAYRVIRAGKRGETHV